MRISNTAINPHSSQMHSRALTELHNPVNFSY